MLAVSPLTNCTPGERAEDATASNLLLDDDFFVDFDFDFSELFDGFDDVDVLPGLEVDFPSPETVGLEAEVLELDVGVRRDGGKVVGAEEETVSVVYEDVLSCETVEEVPTKMSSEMNSSAPEQERGRKPSAGHARGSVGKRKMKVDWTPELHRQFVQAVEQLGVEKAVPSRILELMGIDCLTRHNVASHLQKYRSHQKHMFLREAESTSWTQRSKIYPMATTITPGNISGAKKEISSWSAPTMGFPTSAPPPPLHMHSFRPLHVWGHPTMDQSIVHMWHPRHVFPMRPAPSPPCVSPHPSFQPSSLLPHASPWNAQFSTGTLSPRALYFPQQVPMMRFPTPVPGIPPHPLCRPEDFLPAATPPTPAPTNQTGWQLQHDDHPSSESIDEAIGEVLVQPWLPVPLGLKPPSLESVMEELQKQGISNVPPSN